MEGLTGIFCSISDGPGIYLSKPIFDRAIDLKWFGIDQNEFARSKLQKIDFGPKLGQNMLPGDLRPKCF